MSSTDKENPHWEGQLCCPDGFSLSRNEQRSRATFVYKSVRHKAVRQDAFTLLTERFQSSTVFPADVVWPEIAPQNTYI